MARTHKAAAIALGREHGENAAGWWIQENGGGRDTRGAKETAAWAVKLLEDWQAGAIGDEQAGFPCADLSGEWADGLTPAGLASECGLEPEADPEGWRTQELCDAYESAFYSARDRAIYRHLRACMKVQS